ncbi:MAG: exo-alpha-sialidase [Myxococcaceae bacterium]
MSENLFVASRKGLFQFHRGSSRWEIADVSFRGDAVSIVLPDEGDGAIYAGMGLGHYGVKLRRSRDGGKTWTDIATPAFPKQPEGQSDTLPDGKPWPWRVEQIWALERGAKAGQLWCGTIGGGLFRSDDAGESWELVSSLWNHPDRKKWFGGGAEMPGIHSICVDPKDGRRVLLGVSCGGAWLSEDDGKSWRVVSHGMFAEFMPPARKFDPVIQDPHRIVQCPAAPNRLWCQHHNGVFRSDDRGLNWNEVPNVTPAVFGFAVAVHPKDPDTAWLVPAQKDDQRVPVDAKVVVSRTRDGGKTWEPQRNGLPQEHAYDITLRHALDIDRTGNRLAFGSSTGGLWITENGGDGWAALSNHLPPIYSVRFGGVA